MQGCAFAALTLTILEIAVIDKQNKHRRETSKRLIGERKQLKIKRVFEIYHEEKSKHFSINP